MCVENKVINVQQCTIFWHVDDNMMSHVDTEVLDKVLAKTEERFPGLVVSKSVEHTFLGMNGCLGINIKDYFLKCKDHFGGLLLPKVVLPSTKWLFEANEDSRKLV